MSKMFSYMTISMKFSICLTDAVMEQSYDTLCDSIMSKLNSEFSMKDLGPLKYFLGISVTIQ